MTTQYESYTQHYIYFDEHAVEDGVRDLLEQTPLVGQVLDIGSGYGNYLGSLTGAWNQYLGVEPNGFFRDEARAKAVRLGLPCVFVEGVAEALPVQDAWADTVLTTFAFGELDTVARVQSALGEVVRVAKPGAMVVFAELTGGRKDGYFDLLNTVEVLSGERPCRDIADVWIEALSFFAAHGVIVRRERVPLRYRFADKNAALDTLSAITPGLASNAVLRAEVGARFPDAELSCEAMFVVVQLR